MGSLSQALVVFYVSSKCREHSELSLQLQVSKHESNFVILSSATKYRCVGDVFSFLSCRR